MTDFGIVRTWGPAVLDPYEGKPKSWHRSQRYTNGTPRKVVVTRNPKSGLEALRSSG
jgi:hypothetical protein